MTHRPLPPHAMDASQLLDEAEATGCPIAIEAARRLWTIEPAAAAGETLFEWTTDEIPHADPETLGEWLAEALQLKVAVVGDRDHLRALLELVDTEGTEAAAQYIRETVRDWLF